MQEDDLDATLRAIVFAAVGTVPGAAHASISSVEKRKRVTTRASTGDLPLAVDRAQYETGEGPCLDSLFEHRTVRLSDLRTEERWPEFTRRALDLGVGSMLAVQLYVDEHKLGALNLFNEQSDAFTDESEHVALLFASHASVAMVGAGEQAQLHAALGTRGVIGQALGILMERHKVTGDRAFGLLTRVSQNNNSKLSEIALQLVSTGELPGQHTTSGGKR
ncbi:GAF and ANTAR domain-containing protein [Pengzhenrongella sp.]|uniref:GAF and ANTAR domain-containing protein n=1 Tax=Pengzhenrongella sp. TaxID=2888820 RepID=UPI002F94A758